MKPRLPFRLIYHPGYDLNLGAHVFPSQKFRLIRERLLAEQFATLEDFEKSEPASDEQILLFHQAAWFDALRSYSLSPAQRAKLENPWGPETLQAVRLATGSSFLPRDTPSATASASTPSLVEYG